MIAVLKSLCWSAQWRRRIAPLVILTFGIILNLVKPNAALAASSKIASIEYLFADSKITSARLLSREGWSKFDSKKNSLSPRSGQALWLKIKIDHHHSDPTPTLNFDKIFVRYKFFKGEQVISEFGADTGYPGLPPHLITVPFDRGLVEYHMRIQSEATRIGPIGGVAIGHRSDFIVDMMKSDSVKLFVVSVLGLLGIVGLILFVNYKHVKTYLYLSMFSLCGMFYLAAGLKLRSVLGIDPVLIGNASYIGLYAAPLFFIEFYKHIFSLQSLPKYLSLVRTISFAFLSVAIVSPPFLPVGLLSLLSIFYIVAIPAFLAVLIHAYFNREYGNYRRTFYTGFLFLFLAGLWEAANEIRLINSSFRAMPLGMLLFYLALATMQGQFFANLFRTAKENAQNETVARERLQRVLSCTYVFAQSRDYNSLFMAAAENIARELKIQDEIHSVDFLFSRISSENSEHSEEAMTHFTYTVESIGESGQLRQIVGNSKSNFGEPPKTAGNMIDDGGPVLSQSPLILMSPSSTITVPIDFGFFHGAVVVRRYAECGFSSFEQDLYFEFVQSISASLAVTLKNIDFLRKVAQKAVMDSQLDAARAQQNALSPKAPNIENIEYASFSRSADKTGGDWHGCFFDEKHNRLFVTVGDVTGHDFASSILTGVAAGAVRAWEENDAWKFDSAQDALVELAAVVNRVICSTSQGLKFMTMVFVCLEVDKGVCHFVSAGHVPPFHLSRGERPLSIPFSGHILGQSFESRFNAQRVELNDGDQIILYTDGLFDNENAFGEKLQKRQFVRFWQSNREMNPTFEGFVEMINQIWGDSELEDDVTLVCIGWKSPKVSLGSAA